MSMRTITIEEFHAGLREQGVAREDLAMICPCCGTIQSARSLITAGAGASFAEVEKYLGFSCVGRWTGAGPAKKGAPHRGCDWTFGGFFRIHSLEVIAEDGSRHPRFELASPEEASRLAELARGADAPKVPLL